MRQPVIILHRGHRVSEHIKASVFPLYHPPGATWPTTGAAMAHGGSEAECEKWISERSDHVELYGTAYECSDWTDQHLQYSRLVNGRPVPERCTWRPPEERVEAIAKAEADVARSRGQAIDALDLLVGFISNQRTAIEHGVTGDYEKLNDAAWSARCDVERHARAHAHLAKLTSGE